MCRGYADLCARAGRDDVPVAVRSSALAEDGAAASFAGQQDTFLHVTGAADVLARIRDCWAGLWTPQAVAYRARHAAGGNGTGADAPAMAVAVKELVDARVAGVAFTVSPTTGDPSIVAINASWGLGEAVVSGEVTPDEFWVSKVGPELVRSTVAAKARRCVPAVDGRGTVITDVPADLVSAPCLDAALVVELAELAIRVERHYGSPQDIEWALAADADPPGHRFLLLQSRPETVHAKSAKTARTAAAAPGYLSVLQQFGAARREAR